MLIISLQGCAAYQNYKFTEQAKTNNQPLVVKWFSPTMPNSAGGVDVHPNIENISNNTIKYIEFNVTPYNAVGDKVYSEVGGISTRLLKMTGPYKPGYDTLGFVESFTSSYFDNVWYNYQLSCIEIEDIKIIYMDNSSVYYDKSNIGMIVRQENNCKK